jgi:hypothetical protein
MQPRRAALADYMIMLSVTVCNLVHNFSVYTTERLILVTLFSRIAGSTKKAIAQNSTTFAHYLFRNMQILSCCESSLL